MIVLKKFSMKKKKRTYTNSWSYSYFQVTEMKHCQEPGGQKDTEVAS